MNERLYIYINVRIVICIKYETDLYFNSYSSSYNFYNFYIFRLLVRLCFFFLSFFLSHVIDPPPRLILFQSAGKLSF